MNITHIGISLGLGLLAGWLAKALHIKTKSASQADKLLNAPDGTAQGLLDAAAQALLAAASQQANRIP